MSIESIEAEDGACACGIAECDEFPRCERRNDPQSCPLYRMMQRRDLAVWRPRKDAPVVKVSKMTGRVEKRYGGIGEAGDDLGLPRKAVSRACSQKTFAEGAYYLRYEADYDPAERFDDDKRCVPYVVVDVESLTAAHADNAVEAARMLDASTKTVYKLANKGGLLKGRFAVARRKYADGFLAIRARLRAARACRRAGGAEQNSTD